MAVTKESISKGDFKKETNRGMALVTTIILMAVLMGFGLATWRYYTSDITFSSNYRYSREALYLAEAGIQEAIYRLKLATTDAQYIGETGTLHTDWNKYLYAPNLSPLPTTPSGPNTTHSNSLQSPLKYGVSSYPLWVRYKTAGGAIQYDGAYPIFIITSTGTASNGSRKTIEVEAVIKGVQITPPNQALGTGKSVSVSGSAFIDGTNHKAATDLNDQSPNDAITDSAGYKRNFNNTYWTADAATTSVTAVQNNSGTINVGVTNDSKGPHGWGTRGADAILAGGITTFPTFQSMINLSDKEFQELLNTPTTSRADLDAGTQPSGFIYLQLAPGETYTMASVPSLDPNEFALMYVALQTPGTLATLRISSNWQFKGFIYVDGDLRITGTPVFLGGVMVKQDTNVDDDVFLPGNMSVLFSREAIQNISNNQKIKLVKIRSWKEIAR